MFTIWVPFNLATFSQKKLMDSAFFWGWDQIENIFLDLATFKSGQNSVYSDDNDHSSKMWVEFCSHYAGKNSVIMQWENVQNTLLFLKEFLGFLSYLVEIFIVWVNQERVGYDIHLNLTTGLR